MFNISLKSLYQHLTQFHENQSLIAWSTTLAGNIILWSAVCLFLWLTRYAGAGIVNYLALVPLMILTQQYPSQRKWIMGLGLGSLFLYNRLIELGDGIGLVLDAGIVVGLLYIFYRIAKSFTVLPRIVRNNPQIFLHLLLWCGIAAIALLPENFRTDPSWAVLSSFTVCWALFAFLIWRIGYMIYLGKRGSIKSTDFMDHMVYCLPYLGPTQVPYGKGHDYLASKQANTRLDQARAQLAGLKLLIMAFLWSMVLQEMEGGIFDVRGLGGLSLPSHLTLFHIDNLISISAAKLPPLGILWASLIMDMVYETLQLAVTGHIIVGCLRLFGFNIFRNTYKPLLATTLTDFWNRYYFYFKELLVDFFFYPTYLSFFKKHPKLRIFAATMASACLGNFYYHFLQYFDSFIIDGGTVSFTKFYSYFFYSFVLGIGIYFSIMREQGRRGKPVPPRHPAIAFLVTVRKIAGVWLFFSLVGIWDHSGAVFMQDTAFFFSLFGIQL